MASSRRDCIGHCGHEQSLLARQSKNEPPVLISVHKLRDLKVAPEDTDIEAIQPIEGTARVLQAVELSVPVLQPVAEDKL